MTTTQRTPYLAVLAEEEASIRKLHPNERSEQELEQLATISRERRGYLQGVADAKAEDAPLRAALAAIRKEIKEHPNQETWQIVTGVRNILLDLDAQAAKGGPK